MADATGEFHPLAENMSAKDVALLNPGGICRRHADTDIREGRHLSAVLAGQDHGGGLKSASLLQGSTDIAAVPGRGDAHEHVSRLAQCLHLAFENLVVAKVVGDSRQN